ncbi:hypothetical protein [Tepidibacter hydrothermalis]|uniref:Uncharacterized protein n=1 Tax=Tepidibacter hydrothermalis TaxID=3036126 RepID=A0ABY8EC64_9FIRM|nr:hypothetical protein [Tepidibacter hydrothermalis]WFD09490.1 hypothetical protein P4S50_13990 [Tepidibacter hydrothermalis]
MGIDSPSSLGAFMLVYMIFILGFFGLSVYCLVLFIKLARRGIKALDIYIGKNDI